MKMSKNILTAVIILIVTAATGFAQVNRDELQDLPPVTFINYEGPHARVDTREAIRQIGVSVGRQVNEREGSQAAAMDAMTLEQRRAHSYQYNVGAANRYFVIHCVSGPDGSKLDADILGLGVDAGVDHIRNLRVIIQGYLQAAYNYSPSDALLLAEFITIYNAVYRGNWDYFQNRYKSMVINNLTSDKAGLSIRYDEWPGRTLILIPLGIGGLSAVDTAAISDARVIEEMRREDDQGVPQRQQLVNLIEREAEQAERQAQVERQEARQEERQIVEERRQTEQERQQVQEERASGRITEEQAAAREEELARRDEQLDRREEAVAERREEAQRLEEHAEQRTQEAQEQRQQIAQDQQAAIAQETPPTGVFGVTIERTSPTTMGRVVRINPADGSEIRRSPLDLTHIRTITFISGRLIAIAGEARGQGAVRLVEINQTGLEMAKQGDDDILTGSLLWVNGSDLYAITVHEGKNYIGRFNTELVIQSRSAVEVHPQAGVTIQQGRLLTQRANGSPLALDPANLTEVR
ncbi:MAG: hypothetical protein FWC01_04150 [Treponema sp.]|nr:hypothetical protein [Treponema sp.]MCL2237104.1 hypothetical protein [Treponema sp.]